MENKKVSEKNRPYTASATAKRFEFNYYVSCRRRRQMPVGLSPKTAPRIKFESAAISASYSNFFCIRHDPFPSEPPVSLTTRALIHLCKPDPEATLSNHCDEGGGRAVGPQDAFLCHVSSFSR